MFRQFERLLLASLFVLLGFAAAHAGGPRLTISETTYDAGELPQGKPLAHEFVLKNVGDGNLTYKVKPC